MSFSVKNDWISVHRKEDDGIWMVKSGLVPWMGEEVWMRASFTMVNDCFGGCKKTNIIFYFDL